jgi:MFS family permease
MNQTSETTAALEITLPGSVLVRSVIACLLSTFILQMAVAVMGNMLQLYFNRIDATAYPISNTLSNIIVAIFYLPELLGSPVLGAMSDHYGRKLFMLLGPLAGAIAVQLTAMTTNLGVLFFTRLLEGLSTASTFPATLGYLSAVTSKNEGLRGRVMGLFEIATLGGILIGLFLAGRFWDAFGPAAFTLNSGIYLVSLALFFFGITQLRQQSAKENINLRRGFVQEFVLTGNVLRETFDRLRQSLLTPRIVRFVPAWLAINMIVGAWTNSSIRQLVSSSDRFPNQTLFGIFAGANAGSAVSLYGACVLALFAGGVFLWSLTFARFKRTSVMLVGVVGIFVLAISFGLANHLGQRPYPLLNVYGVGAVFGLMLASGFTPAALTYLADVTEDDPGDRGGIMGLYTVFFGIGQFFGTLLSGPFVDASGVDGLILLTLLLGLPALYALVRLHLREMRLSLTPAAS